MAQSADARRIAGDLRLDFTRAVDASNRAVMADTDETSIAFAAEAQEAKRAVRKQVEDLTPLLRDLKYEDETRSAEEFQRRFAEYDTLDNNVLALAVENTNLKAQRLSFGAGSEAADAFKAALQAVAGSATPKASCRIAALTSGAILAVREIQILQAPHIAEASDSAMTKIEKDMDALAASVTDAVGTLSTAVEPASQPHLAAARAAFDRFKSVHAEIIVLSRRNSNVRSLMLSLGQKRTLSSACDASLTSLADGLAKKRFPATR